MRNWTAGLGALAILSPTAVLAQQGEGRWYGHGHMWDGGYGMIFMPIFWFLVLGLVAVGVVWAVRLLGDANTQRPSRHDPAPIDILRARYARGEIDTADFEERSKRLQE